jgi:hypothetical protein
MEYPLGNQNSIYENRIFDRRPKRLFECMVNHQLDSSKFKEYKERMKDESELLRTFILSSSINDEGNEIDDDEEENIPIIKPKKKRMGKGVMFFDVHTLPKNVNMVCER